jgi:hypothetical protein
MLEASPRATRRPRPGAPVRPTGCAQAACRRRVVPITPAGREEGCCVDAISPQQEDSATTCASEPQWCPTRITVRDQIYKRLHARGDTRGSARRSNGCGLVGRYPVGRRRQLQGMRMQHGGPQIAPLWECPVLRCLVLIGACRAGLGLGSHGSPRGFMPHKGTRGSGLTPRRSATPGDRRNFSQLGLPGGTGAGRACCRRINQRAPRSHRGPCPKALFGGCSAQRSVRASGGCSVRCGVVGSVKLSVLTNRAAVVRSSPGSAEGRCSLAGKAFWLGHPRLEGAGCAQEGRAAQGSRKQQG